MPDDLHAPSTLGGLPFVDLYVRIDGPAPARYRPEGRDSSQPGNMAVPDGLRPDIDRLLATLVAHPGGDEHGLVFDQMRLRVTRQRMADGQLWAACRRVLAEVPDLEKLGYPPQLLSHLRALGRRTGLVIMAGPTGHGKTTSAFALLDAFLARHGHVAYTIEDPVEFDIQGPRGRGGWCFQVEVSGDDEWAPALKRALRWQPRYILTGEVRTPEAANQVLRAATTGHLVLTTIHAGSIEESLIALMQMAEFALGNRAQQLLADGLAAVIHQTLGASGPHVDVVFTQQDSVGDPVRAAIRANKIAQIGTYIDQQSARILGPRPWPVRGRDGS